MQKTQCIMVVYCSITSLRRVMAAARRAFCFEVWFLDFSGFFPARETFNILNRTGRSLTTFSGKDKVIAFLADEKMIHDDRVAKKFWNEIIFKPTCFVII